MTPTTAPRPAKNFTGFLADSPPYVRHILLGVGGLALISLVRILAHAPDLTAGDMFIAAIVATITAEAASAGTLRSDV